MDIFPVNIRRREAAILSGNYNNESCFITLWLVCNSFIQLRREVWSISQAVISFININFNIFITCMWLGIKRSVLSYKEYIFSRYIYFIFILMILLYFKIASRTLGVWPDNPSRSAFVELMAKYCLQTLPRNIFAYYYDRVTCQKHKTCFVQFCYCFKKHPKMSTNNTEEIVKFSFF